jgi:hypothetical protein
MRRLTQGTERCGRGALRVTALLTLLSALLVVPATAGAATAGGLKQLAGATGCLSGEASPPSDCTAVRGLGTNIGEAAMTKDGKQVYVTSRDKDAVVLFNRNATTGKLTQASSLLGCFTTDTTTQTNDGCSNVTATVSALDQADAIAVAPDGRNVVVTTVLGNLSNFKRDTSGGLTFVSTESLNVSGSANKSFPALTVAPDNRTVYLAGPGSIDGILWAFNRDVSGTATHGNISLMPPCYAVTACAAPQIPNLRLPSDMFVTPDNKQLIVASGEDQGAVIGFDRNISSSGTYGTLDGTAANTASRCVTGIASLANCQFRPGTDYPRGVTNVGNRDIYVRGYYAQTVVRRNASTNALSAQTSSPFCAAYEGSGFTGCNTPRNCTVFCGGRGVFATPDGKFIYDGNDSNGSIFGLGRNSSDGSIAGIPTALGCLTTSEVAGCNSLRQGTIVRTVVGDNKFVYGAGGARIFAFGIDHPPVCQNVSAGTVNTASVTVTFNCSDPDGDALTYEKVSDPSRGTLAGVSGNHVSYGPQPGTTGVDTFQYRARAAGVASDPATASVNVTAPAAPPGGGGGGGGGTPPALTVVPSTASINSLGFKKFTKLLNLAAKNLPSGATVVVTCKTKKKSQQKKGCPYKSKRFTTSGARASLNLRKPFAKRKVPVGTKITITITAPGFLGKRIQYLVRKGKIPKSTVRCLSAAGKAGSCA